MSFVELAPNYFTLPNCSPLREKITKAYRWYSPKFSPRDVPRFMEVGSITENPTTLQSIRNFFVERYRNMKDPPTHLLGFDARGFLFGPMISVELGLPFVLIRKADKNAGLLIRSDPYKKEYSEEQPEFMTIRRGTIDRDSRVVLIDDVVATGGTVLSGLQLVDACGATVVEVAAILGISALKGAQLSHSYNNGYFSKVPFFVLVDESAATAENCGDVPNYDGPRVISCSDVKANL